ncbi:hypothetical protein [Bradyrhizobium sp. UFLA05-112]
MADKVAGHGTHGSDTADHECQRLSSLRENIPASMPELIGRLLLLKMMPITTADQGGRFVAYDPASLGSLSRREIYRRPRAADP